MQLNPGKKIMIVIVTILVGLAGFNIYNNNTPTKRELRELRKGIIGFSPEEIPKDFKNISQKYNYYEDLYNTDEVILTFGYEDKPMTLGYGKDFHDDFLKRLKKENIDFKVVPYHNFQQIKEKIIEEKGNTNEGCSMDNGLKEDLKTLVAKTEECLINICLINNPKGEFIMLNRHNMDYAINVLKKYSNNETN